MKDDSPDLISEPGPTEAQAGGDRGPGVAPADSRAAAATDPDVTQEFREHSANASRIDRAVNLPRAFGRYEVRDFRGEGGFGTVYVGFDTHLGRPVAIKVPRPDRIGIAGGTEQFVQEARRLARLKHPGIVTVHDVGSQDGQCYIVSDFVQGVSLFEWLRQNRPSWDQTVRIVAAVSDALAYAHAKHMVHRDVKPSNILLTESLAPVLIDFGLAIGEDEVAAPSGDILGTPAYMSPEQASGEGHRRDGRTDIYSLGVVLYEMLCSCPPFRGSKSEIRRQVREDEPQPPRQIVRDIPHELERICLKAISKRQSDRYTTAGDMAEELRAALPALAIGTARSTSAPTGLGAPSTGSGLAPHVVTPHLETPAAGGLAPTPPSGAAYTGAASEERRHVRIVPKGLRSFGAEDSEFFLELLPGPRDRDGLSDSLRFWKQRIESTDSDRGFAVGLVYGPSGCGKSSLVRAGLLPRLAERITPVYIEATRDDTEARLASALRKALPGLDSRDSLATMFSHLRRGRGLAGDRKVLIVLDQFEQWLHAHSQDMEKSELLAALRQADGTRVQVLMLVRDDFWLGVSRLFDRLEIHLDPERNTRLVDLFDLRHAERVLFLIGHAFDRFPASRAELTPDQKRFLDQAANELSQDGRVIPVRLSLFAELMKDRSWTLDSLVAVGGTEGVGVRFLEETFTARTAVPEHRALEKPARALLQSLLPEGGTDIKGNMRSRAELAKDCGLPESSPRFNRLLAILDHDLHIITPTETEAGGAMNDQRGSLSVERGEREHAATSGSDAQRLTLNSQPSFYQLTHDYLVPPLRHWLTLERCKTWRGRAELCLEEHTTQMTQWPESRYLPSPTQFLTIAAGVPSRRRRPEQRALMREATRHYGSRWGAAFAVMLLALIALMLYRDKLEERRIIDQVELMLDQSPDHVEASIARIEYSGSRAVRRAVALLRERFSGPSRDTRAKLHATFALARLDNLREQEREFLLSAAYDLSPAECKNLISALNASSADVNAELLRAASDRTVTSRRRVRAATILLHLGIPDAARELLKLNHEQSDPPLRAEFINGFRSWHGDLSLLPDVLRHTADGDFRSGVCVALGQIAPELLGGSERQALTQVLDELANNACDGGTHSGAGWALRQWGQVQGVAPRTLATQSRNNRDWFVNAHGMTMIRIPKGEFEMGDVREQLATPHRVELSECWMSDCEISVRLFRQYIEDPDWPENKKRTNWKWQGRNREASPEEDCPVQSVTWFDAVRFCNWLSAKEGLQECYDLSKPDVYEWIPGRAGYRLPTEAEWEYACRASTVMRFAFGEIESSLAPYAVIVSDRTLTCGTKGPNGWGLFDMNGNVAEWCWDFYEPYEASRIKDPAGPTTGSDRVCRGGYYSGPASHCAAGKRFQTPPALATPTIGFRIVFSQGLGGSGRPIQGPLQPCQ